MRYLIQEDMFQRYNNLLQVEMIFQSIVKKKRVLSHKKYYCRDFF